MNIFTQTDFDIDQDCYEDALAGLRAVEAAKSFGWAYFSMSDGAEFAIDYPGALLDPAGALALGVWERLERQPRGDRLYKGVALGLACLGGAMTGLPMHRLLPHRPGAQGDVNGGGWPLGAARFDGLARIDGLQGEYASMVSNGRLFVCLDAASAARGDFLPLECDRSNIVREAAARARWALSERWDEISRWYRLLSVERAKLRRRAGEDDDEIEAAYKAACRRYNEAAVADMKAQERFRREDEAGLFALDAASARLCAAREAMDRARWRLEDAASSARRGAAD